jgi:hypothetical protein
VTGKEMHRMRREIDEALADLERRSQAYLHPMLEATPS